ncbi:MAG: aldehyde dehydrogenase family protein [Clostridiales Family XIII bacterium]|jgi:acyl-CoA reductase-like NAD-dependent aldehyde dehydrogenase|nr:aldehyde dehydrogenase family protein [Clostridiales Family XIII bacterium]
MIATKMYIGGAWTDAASGKTFETLNPSTNEPFGTVPLAGAEDIDKAVAAARAAFPAWSSKTQAERSAVLNRISAAIRENAEEFAMLGAKEHGMPAKLGFGPTMGASGNFEMAATYARATGGDFIHSSKPNVLYCLDRVPIGVCALIIPWNLPLFLMSQKIALSISTGNTCVVKPPSINSIIGLRLAEIIDGVEGLPKGVVNVITGPGSSVGHALAAHPGVDCVGFTGSTETGVSIMEAAAPTLKKVIMELGGKNPAIIFPDANLDQALESLGHHQFFNCGQACGSPGRYYVHESVFDAFLEKLLACAKHQVVGDPTLPETTMGPMVSAEHANKVMAYIESGVSEGAKLVHGGRRALDKGNFIEPTIFTDVTPSMKIYREEIFGPVAVLLKWKDEDAVIDLANDNTYGLTASIWTTNVARALKLGRRLTVGTFSVNGHNLIAPEAPWGGVRQSGIGKEGGWQGVLEYTEQKMITINLDEE